MSKNSVNSPNHYTPHVEPTLRAVRVALMQGLSTDPRELECFVAMVNALDTVDQIRGYLRGNIFKYQWRYRYKNGIEDLEKANWYYQKLLLLEDAEVIARG